MCRTLAAAALVALAGCGHHATPAPPDMAYVGAFVGHDKVDILFMIDDSPSIPYVHQAQQWFPELIKAFQDSAAAGHPASYHIGIVSSDLGAGPEILNQGQCRPDGDGGKLQVGPTAMANGVPPACSNLSLGGGVRFIDYDQIQGTLNSNLDVVTTWECMSALGSSGCGFEHQLESVYRALHDPPPENAGFLRDDALLVVFFITDEDDCSAPPDTDLFDPSPDGIAKYGTLHSFRCTQFGVQCNGQPVPPMSISGLTGCSSQVMANGGKLFDVQRYIDFFDSPNGVKADPSDVILASISAPPSPVGVSVTMPCADQVNTPSCPILNHSCLNASDANFFGDPGVRLAAVVNAAHTALPWSICDIPYSQPMQDLAQKIIARLQ